jgi:hypothetical protein
MSADEAKILKDPAKTDRIRAFPLNDKHRRFCQNILAGMTHAEAYISAGFTGKIAAKGFGPNRLFKEPAIQNYFTKLRAEQRLRLDVSINTIVLELEGQRLGAERDGKWADATNASLAKAKLLGLYTEKAEVDLHLIPKPFAHPVKELEMSVEEWQAHWSPKKVANGDGSQ